MIDVQVIKDEALMITRPRGVFDAKMAEEIVAFIEVKELELETGFNRFCDLNFLEGMPISFTEILRLAGRRSSFNPNDIRVKSAFLATDSVAFGVANIYQHLLDSPRIEVRVFHELEAAAQWLGVKSEKLRP